MVDTKAKNLNSINSQKDREANLPLEIEIKKDKRISIIKAYKTFCNRKLFICLIFGILGSIGGGITAQLLEYFTGELISKLNDISSDNDMIMHNVKKICVIYLIIAFFSFLCGYLQICLFTYVSKEISNKYKIEYYKMMINLEQNYYDLKKKSINEICNQIIIELESIEGGLGSTMGNLINQSSCVIFGIVFALTICWKLALVLICVFPILIFIQINLISIISKKTENLKKLNEKNSGYLEEILYNIKTVASFCNFDYEKNKYENELEDCVLFAKKFGAKSSFSIAFLNLCMSLMFSLTFFVGGYLLYKKETNGNKLLDSGNIYSVLSLVTSAGFQLPEMATNFKVLIDCLTNLKNFYDLRNYMKKKEKEKNNSNKIIIQSDDNEKNSKNNMHLLQGSISFKNVNFSYPNNSNKVIFKNLNLEIPANKTTAIIGKSGCGKSTLLNLIEKIYKPNSGEILLDNINIDDIDINSLRDKIGYVAQEPILFNDTIKNNIIFGRNLENEDELVDLAIKNAYAYNFVHKFPDKLNHIVGIKGGKISGGQKQRLAIARALYKQPEILILDEATSALDNKSEKKVQKSIDNLKGKVTIIIISQRLKTIQFADNIIFLGNEGKILEEGNHDYLMNLKGNYYDLYMQGIDNNQSLNSEKSESNFSKTKSQIYTDSTKELKSEEDVRLQIEDKPKNKKIKNNFPFKKMFNTLKQYKYITLLAIICSFLNGVLTVFVGWLIGGGIDAISNEDLDKVKKGGYKYGMYHFALGIAILSIEFFRYYFFEILGEYLVKFFKSKIFDFFLKVHLSYFDKIENTPGNLVSKINIKTSKINGTILSLLSMFIQCFGNFITCLIMGILIDYRITLIFLSFLIFIILGNYFSSQINSKREKTKLNNSYGDLISEHLSNLFTIKCFNAQNSCYNNFVKCIYTDNNNFKYSNIVGLFYGLTLSVIYFDYSLTFYIAGKFYVSDKIELGTFLKCFDSITIATFFISLASKYIKDVSLMKEAIQELYEQLELKSEIDPTKDNDQLIKKNNENFLGKIEFKNVSFAYPSNPNHYIINDINFVINPGERIGIIGGSGAGKSTITQLIERFYDINEGEILIDDVPIKNYNLINLRNFMSFVQQEPVIFKTNIYDNIKYGNLNCSEKEIENISNKCLIKCNLNEDLNKLSAGEKQKIAIARTLMKKNKILILDEATSALDNESEDEIQNLLDNIILNEKMTVIIIAHKLKTVKKCDRCYKMKNGKIVKVGTLEEIYA